MEFLEKMGEDYRVEAEKLTRDLSNAARLGQVIIANAWLAKNIPAEYAVISSSDNKDIRCIPAKKAATLCEGTTYSIQRFCDSGEGKCSACGLNRFPLKFEGECVGWSKR